MSGSDEICPNCTKVDFYSLFTGPRYFPGDGFNQRVKVKLGTLAKMKANTRCPACRLIIHDLHAGGQLAHPWEYCGDEVDPSQVQVVAIPVRGDHYEDMKYSDAKRNDMLATNIQIRLVGIKDCSQDLTRRIGRYDRGPGIRLLSPKSVVPERPLLNGFRATNRENSLKLVRQWMKTCRESHKDTCHFSNEAGAQLTATRLGEFRFIDVAERKLVERKLTEVPYAALSYVWRQEHTDHDSLWADLAGQVDRSKDGAMRLPENMPRVIEDAIFACQVLPLPYLWVDLYCIDKRDNDRKASEINSMGHIYQWSEITLVAGSPAASHKSSDNNQWGLTLAEWNEDHGQTQRTETIGGRKYITTLPSITTQIQRSLWHKRSWTVQESELATRVAFFWRL